MGDECSTFIKSEYIAEYQELHKAICLNLNRMIWNIAFLKKSKEAQENGARCRNDFVIGHLYKNEFELLILRLHRTLFDEGQDVITLPRLRDNLFKKYLLNDCKQDLIIALKDNQWDSPEVEAAKRNLVRNVPALRNHYIAHTLVGEPDEYSVSFLDAEKVVMAACDLLNKLSFGLESFYFGREKFYLNYESEKTSSEQFLEEFFTFQQTSAWCIKELNCSYASKYQSEDDQSEIVRKKIDSLNSLFHARH